MTHLLPASVADNAMQLNRAQRRAAVAQIIASVALVPKWSD